MTEAIREKTDFSDVIFPSITMIFATAFVFGGFYVALGNVLFGVWWEKQEIIHLTNRNRCVYTTESEDSTNLQETSVSVTY